MNKVVHFEIPSDDLARAKGFYSQVFGWKINNWPMPDGNVYTGALTTEVDETGMKPKEPGAINGALVSRAAETPQPIVTIGVESIDEHLAKIEAAGGNRVTERIEIPDMGAYAYFKDSEGNVMGLWEDAKQA